MANHNNGNEPDPADPGDPLIARTSGLKVPEDSAFRAPKREFPAFVQLDAFLARELPKPPELVKGLFHQGSKIILGGGSKSYKTWLLSDLAISVASGLPWVGFETAGARVLYVNLELGCPWFQSRLTSILESMGLVREGKEGEWMTRLDIWNLRGYCADGDALLDELERRTEGQGYGLIIGDPLYKLLAGRQENSAEDMSDLFNRLEEISEKSRAACIYACHFSKGNQSMKDSIDRVSGSGVFGRDPDTVITITPHKVKGAFTFEAITRNLPPVPPFVILWDMPFFMREESLDPDLLRKPKAGREKEYKPEMLRGLFIDRKTVTSADLKSFATTTLGMSSSTYYALRKEAVETGLIKQAGKDLWEAPARGTDLSRMPDLGAESRAPNNKPFAPGALKTVCNYSSGPLRGFRNPESGGILQTLNEIPKIRKAISWISGIWRRPRR